MTHTYWYEWRPTSGAMVGAALFFTASLTPSLIPREPAMQGGLSGISTAMGYFIGTAATWLWRFLELPLPQGRRRTLTRIGFAGAATAIAVAGLVMAREWANATRIAVGLAPVQGVGLAVALPVTAGVFLAVWLLFTLLAIAARRIGWGLQRLLPGRLGPLLGIALAALGAWLVTERFVVRAAFETANAFYAAGEQAFDDAAPRPTDPMMTGSDASLIGWEDLGNRGRAFIAGTPDPRDIAAFTGAPALRPVRVYAGRLSAPDPRARAELALAELIRQGGFERSVLVITTPVGTGWMDPDSHDPLDYMWSGDTAHVAAQYSYLTSTLSILTDAQYGFDQARALFDVIYEHWSALPADARPTLYLHGVSQGALNSQATLPFLDVLADPPAGAFWVGSPFLSPVWSQVRELREPGSPEWLPRYGNGSLVRVTNQDNTLDEAAAPWGPIRLVFLQYGTDPIVYFEFATLWRPPDWLSERPRAPDVSPRMRWFPVITGLQVGLDMLAALGVEGHGHAYAAEDYIDAWAALTDPPDWTPERAARLKAIFAARARGSAADDGAAVRVQRLPAEVGTVR